MRDKPDAWLTLTRAAALVGCDRRVLGRACDRSELIFFFARWGRRVRRAEVLAWAERRKRGAS